MTDAQIAQQRANDLKQKVKDMRRLMPTLLLHLERRMPHLRLICSRTHPHHHLTPSQTLLPRRRHLTIRSLARILQLSGLLRLLHQNRLLDLRRPMQHPRRRLTGIG
jgi:hypothetical protein